MKSLEKLLGDNASLTSLFRYLNERSIEYTYDGEKLRSGGKEVFMPIKIREIPDKCNYQQSLELLEFIKEICYKDLPEKGFFYKQTYFKSVTDFMSRKKVSRATVVDMNEKHLFRTV